MVTLSVEPPAHLQRLFVVRQGFIRLTEGVQNISHVVQRACHIRMVTLSVEPPAHLQRLFEVRQGFIRLTKRIQQRSIICKHLRMRFAVFVCVDIGVSLFDYAQCFAVSAHIIVRIDTVAGEQCRSVCISDMHCPCFCLKRCHLQHRQVQKLIFDFVQIKCEIFGYLFDKLLVQFFLFCPNLFDQAMQCIQRFL